MPTAPEQTKVGVGITDGYRYVGVTPPLNEEEIQRMQMSGEIARWFYAEQIEAPGPACTLLTVSSDANGGTPEDRTEHAKRAAAGIAAALRQLKPGQVRHDLSPVWLQGDNSSPFNPNTDPQQS